MLDISRKTTTLRTAIAQAIIKLTPATLERIRAKEIPKGDPLEVAKVAAIQAAKNTSQIIPYCHPLPLSFAGVEYAMQKDRIVITTTAKAIYKTGVEMEALTAASVAALTIYDMLKMLDDSLEIAEIKLVEKRGGKSDCKEHYSPPLKAAVVVISDSVFAGKKADVSGLLIAERLKSEGLDIEEYKILPDDSEEIAKTLIHFADDRKLNLVITTGGTGFGPRDVTPEAMLTVIERTIPGIPETLRSYGQERLPLSMLSRGKAGLRGNTVIINFPGSKGGVTDSLNALFPGLLHAFHMISGGGHKEHTCSR